MTLPTTEAEISLVTWVITTGSSGLFGLTVFFLVRYIRQTDSKFKKIDDNMGKTMDSLAGQAEKFNETAKEFQEKTTEFQRAMNHELFELQKQSLEIEKTLIRTNEKANLLEEKLDKTIEKVEVFGDRLAEHDRQLKKTMKEVSGQGQSLDTLNKEVGKLKIVASKL